MPILEMFTEMWMRLIGMLNELFLRSGPIAAAIANEFVGEYDEMASEGMDERRILTSRC